MTLYETLVEAGVEVSNWQTDLYFPVTDETRASLALFPLQKSIATTFNSNIDGRRMYGVPFAFDPAWGK